MSDDLIINDANNYLYMKYIFKIMEKIDYFPDEIEALLYDKITALLNSKLYFIAGNNINEVFPVETELLYISNIFNKLSSMQKIDVSIYKEWYREYISSFSELLFSDELEVFLATLKVVYLDELNSVYSISFNADTYSPFIEKIKNIDLDNIIYTDYVLAYQVLQILSSNNIKNLDRYQQTISNFNRFIYSYSNYSSLKEQYYGLLLAEQVGMEIDKDTFINNTWQHKINATLQIQEAAKKD